MVRVGAGSGKRRVIDVYDSIVIHEIQADAALKRYGPARLSAGPSSRESRRILHKMAEKSTQGHFTRGIPAAMSYACMALTLDSSCR